jgi:DNA-binding GntR family transcriptional regulator
MQGVAKMAARERAYHELKYRILEGRLPPGTTLLETEVANLLSLSRTPIREALIRLEEEGLVEVKPLKALMDQMEKATRSDDIERWSQFDDAFHSDIVSLCGNSRLQATLRQYWEQQYRARMAIIPLRIKPTLSDEEHRQIVQAILDRDSDEAGRLHQLHRDRTDRQALELLRRQAGKL